MKKNNIITKGLQNCITGCSHLTYQTPKNDAVGQIKGKSKYNFFSVNASFTIYPLLCIKKYIYILSSTFFSTDLYETEFKY